MLRVYRAYLLLGLLTCSVACSAVEDPRDDDAAPDESGRSDEGELGDEDDADDANDPGDGERVDAPTGSLRDGGAASARDAGRDDATGDAGGRDPAVRDAGAGSRQPDASAQRADAGSAPSTSVCPQTDGWDAQAAAFEEQVLVLTNAARAAGHDCGAKGRFGAAPPLTMQNQLRCAARLHSRYMATTGEFSHDQATTGKDVGARLREAGYAARTWGENIAWGQRTPEEVVDGWLESDGHCANIMNAAFREIGVGYAVGGRSGRQAPYWTQNFGTSR